MFNAIHLDELDPKRRAKTERKHLLALAAGRCFYCGAQGANTLDHVIPRTKVGLKPKQNRVVCCRRCNLSKADQDVLLWARGQAFYSAELETRVRAVLRE
jgi:5-methylcytosine-specific restriction endonuclease McrA